MLALTAVFLLSACGGERSGADGASAPTDSAPAASEPDPDRLYEANAMVLEDGSHGPMLCLGGMLTSLPPQCGDVPIAGWDWRTVEGEEALGETVWGAYHVVGTYDGHTFTLSEVAPSKDEPPASAQETDFASPCPEPEDGWRGLDDATQADVHSADAYARSQADYVTSWVTQLDPPAQELGPVIFNAVFTDDAERHEAEIGKRWSGPLCVVARNVPSARELSRIRGEAEAGLDELGLRMLWSHGPGVEPVIVIGVVVDVAGNGQAALDARYGSGVVRLVPALTLAP